MRCYTVLDLTLIKVSLADKYERKLVSRLACVTHTGGLMEYVVIDDLIYDGFNSF